MNGIRDYYKYYAACHQDKRNQGMHLLGNFATVIYILWVLNMEIYWWLLAAPFVVYVFAYPGHWIFEKNKPAGDLKHLLHARICDWIMCYRILRRLDV